MIQVYIPDAGFKYIPNTGTTEQLTNMLRNVRS